MADPEGSGRDVRPSPQIKRERERERERGCGGLPSLLSISAFIHSPVKCNKSLYIFTRCFAPLVYLITFELLKQSTFNQKTKWYYKPLDINFIKNPPILQTLQYKLPQFQQRNMIKLANIARQVFGNSMQASYFERFHWSILNFWTLQTADHAVSLFRCRHAPRSVVSNN